MADGACECITCRGRACRICATCHDRCAQRLADERFPVGSRAEYALSGQEVMALLAQRVCERERIRGKVDSKLVFEWRNTNELSVVHVTIERRE